MWDERMTDLGEIIECESLKKDILQDDLVHGICTQGELTKIESILVGFGQIVLKCILRRGGFGMERLRRLLVPT